MTPQASPVTASRHEEPPNGDLIVFDDVCLLCSGFARFITKFDRVGRFRFVSAHSAQGRCLYALHNLDPDAMETNIVIVDGEPHIKMASFAAAMSALGWPWRSLAMVNLLPRRISDWLYDHIARNRYRFGKRSCPLPSEDLKNRIVDAAAPLPLFQQALGPDFDRLPEAVQKLHLVTARHKWSGEAKVTRGKSLIGALVCRLVGFPPAAEKTPVSVTIERRGNAEVWERRFGDKSFRSLITRSGTTGSGEIRERFGLLVFKIQLQNSQDALHFPVKHGWFLGLPIPKWLLPQSTSCEQEVNGRFVFDVGVAVPGIGTLVRYRGWLCPEV